MPSIVSDVSAMLVATTTWSNTGQTLVKHWSNTIKHWSNTGQMLVNRQ
jgi:hypothetical protein